MRILAPVLAATLALLCGTAAYYCSAGADALPTKLRSLLSDSPIIVCPSVLEIREGERGQATAVEFVIANHGRAALHLSHFRGSCTCAAIQIKRDDMWANVKELTVAGRSSQSVRLMVVGRSQVGTGMRHAIMFRTNDPKRPEHILQVDVHRLLGGLEATPSEVHFGRQLIGERRSAIIRLFDSATPPRQVVAVHKDNEDLKVAFSPALTPTKEAGGYKIGELTVTYTPRTVGELRSGVFIELDRDQNELMRIPVHADIHPPVEITPQRLALPRHSSTGLVMSAVLVCRAHQSHIECVKLPTNFPFLVGQILDVKEGPVSRFRLTLMPDKMVDRQAVVEWRVIVETGDGNSHVIPVLVSCKQSSPSAAEKDH